MRDRRLKSDVTRDLSIRLASDDRSQMLPVDASTGVIDFSKIRVGSQLLQDAVVTETPYRKVNKNFADKEFVLKALNSHDIETVKKISNFYFA